MAFSRRRVFGLTALALTLGLPLTARAADSDQAIAIVEKLQNSQIDILRQAGKLSLKQRYDALRPALGEALDLDGMAKSAYGPGWEALPAAMRDQWTQGFGDYVAATYAQRFEFVEAKAFERDARTEERDGAQIVTSRLIPPKGESLQIDYVVKNTAKGWRIADILANGSVSAVTQWRRALHGMALDELRKRAASMQGR